MKSCAEQGTNRAPVSSKQNRGVSGCEVDTYVRHICGHRSTFRLDARPGRHTYYQRDALTGQEYLIEHVRREHRYIRTFQRDASAEGGLRSAKCTIEEMLHGETSKYCIHRDISTYRLRRKHRGG